MKKVIAVCLVLVILGGGYLLFKGRQSSKSTEKLGIFNGRLMPCNSVKKNCVCTYDDGSKDHFIEPYNIGDFKGDIFQTVKSVVLAMGGQIKFEDNNYLHFTFRSKIFGFIDDLEILHDSINSRLNFRSSSRVGYSDMGVNRKRISNIYSRLQDSTGN